MLYAFARDVAGRVNLLSKRDRAEEKRKVDLFVWFGGGLVEWHYGRIKVGESNVLLK